MSQLITIFVKKDYMKRSAYFLRALLVSVSIGFFAGVSHNKTLSLSASKMCIIDSYAHAEYSRSCQQSNAWRKILPALALGMELAGLAQRLVLSLVSDCNYE